MKKSLVHVAMLASVLSLATALLAPALAQAPAEKPRAVGSAQPFQELFDQSLKEKKGLTLYIGGQSVGGAVTRMVGTDAVELRSQEFSRIIVRLDRIDAVAAH